MEINTLSVVIGIIVGLLTIVGALSGAFKWLWQKVGGFFKGSDELALNVPRKTLVILPKAGGRSCWWHMGGMGEKPAMQIVAKYTVTNVTKIGIVPTVARMRKPASLGHVMVRQIDSQMHGSFLIPPGETTDLHLDFWLVPPVRKEGETLVADVAVLDQFGNEHWIRRVEFVYT
jgi:hypothetical protein